MSRRLRDEAWRRIRDGLDVSGSAKVLLLAIAEHCKAELFAKEEEVAQWVGGLSVRQVGRLRKELIDAGCLVQTAKAAPNRTARFDVLPEETPDNGWQTNAGQPMTDVEGTHPLQRRSSSVERWTTDVSRTQDNGWPTEPEVEPEEPAAAVIGDDEWFALAIEETKRIDAQRRANGGEPIEDVNAYAAVKARDQTWRTGIETERQKETDSKNRLRSMAECERCDNAGFVDLDETNRAKCTHPDPAKELTA